jgi:hypothetical protein
LQRRWRRSLGAVIANNFNLFGHDTIAGVVGLRQDRPTSCRPRPWPPSSIRFFVSGSAVRLSEAASTKAARRIRFAAGVSNIPPGEIAEVSVKLTKQGKKIVRTSKRKTLRA